MQPSIYKRNTRPVNALLAGAVGLAVLTSCTSNGGSKEATSSNSAPFVPSPTATLPPIEVGCQPQEPEKWTGTPSNLNVPRFAQILGVSVTELARFGRYGAATCEQPVSVDRIPTDNPPIVSVADEGGPCAVMGTAEDPRTVTQTPNVIAICVGSK